MQRITADIDSKNPILISWSLFKAIVLIKKIKFIIIKPSNSKGYHLIVWTTSRYNQKQVYKLRKRIGDDKRRIQIDKFRVVGKQTLWNKKFK